MIIVKTLKDLLKKLPEDALIYAYEGEDVGMSIIEKDSDLSWWIRCRESSEIDYHTEGFLPKPIIPKISKFDPIKNKTTLEKRILHLVTQDNQPMGSQRKCCEECGLALESFPDNHFFLNIKDHFTKQKVSDMGYNRCIDKEK